MEYELGELLSYKQPTDYIVKSTDYDYSYNTPVLTAGKSFIIGYTNEKTGIFSNLPVIIFDDFTTSSQYVDFPFKVKSSAMKILSVNSEIADLKYLFYKMQTIQFDSANHKRYWISEYSKIKFDLPTLAEQQCIVKRIETMFSKLDQAQEKAQSVLDSFETRKAAILHKAFTGELTANWRKENEVSLIIHESAFKDICTKITDGFHNSPKPVSKGYPYIMAGDIRENGIDFNNGLFMDEKNHRELYNKAHPENGDILVVNIGAGTGKSAIIDVDFEFSFKNCAILKLNKEIVNSKYVYLFFNLKKDYILKEITRGGAQPFLSLKMINELSITYPPLPEQQEIVRILDTVLEKESRAKESAQTVLDKIALLKKSILARAFRGEL